MECSFKVRFARLEIRRDVGIAPYKGSAKFALQSIKSVGASRHHNSELLTPNSTLSEDKKNDTY